jgi:GH25 family lysozyme M1 (1,4-beta-N-acetylmuramidase)
MTSFIRSSIGAGATLALVAGLTAGVASGAAPAEAASAPPTATATPTAPAAPAATATASPSARPAPSTTSTTSAPKPAAKAPAASAGATSVATDPSLAAMNASGNHSMGSTIPDAAAAKAAPKSRMLLQAQAASTGPAGLPGLDVSAYQPSVNWQAVYNQGARFAYIKSTEGTGYTSSTFASQYANSFSVGMSHGAYHFATPNTSSGATQARFFVANGGSWKADGRTLPPLLDIEYGYNGTCWGLTQPAMVSWIRDFTSTVKSLTGIQPAIYTTTDWWSRCTGDSNAFSANPLFVARYTANATPGTLGASWRTHAFWQWSSTGPFPGDSDVFNGTAATLQALTLGGLGTPLTTQPATPSAMIRAGATLRSGATVTSSNKQYTLTLQTDGNMVLRGNGRVLWQSQTSRNPGAWFSMQTDGNAVLYSAANKPIWYTGTSGTGSAGSFVVQSNGDLTLTNSSGVTWKAPVAGYDLLMPGYTLKSGQLLHDLSGQVQALMQGDGNFVLYIGGKAKWSTRTQGNAGAVLKLQTDGNLVIYDTAGNARWNTHTATVGNGTNLSMRADGKLVLYKGATGVWDSGTSLTR